MLRRSVVSLGKRNSLTFRKPIPRGSPRPDPSAIERSISDRNLTELSHAAQDGAWYGAATHANNLRNPRTAMLARLDTLARRSVDHGGPSENFSESGKSGPFRAFSGADLSSISEDETRALTHLDWETGVTHKVRGRFEARARRFLERGAEKCAARTVREDLRERFDSFQVIAREGKKLPIVASIVLERLPVVMPKFTKWDSDFHDLELQYSKETGKLYPENFQRMGVAAVTDAAGEATLRERQEQLKADFERGLAARVTDADRSGDTTSTNRKLSKRLYLVSPVGFESGAGFPQARRNKGESMLETARRALRESAGESLAIEPVSALPVAHHVYRNDDGSGARVFFFRCQYVEGQAEGDGHEWLSLWELQDKLSSEYFASVRPALAK